jgi:hypothetical protein
MNSELNYCLQFANSFPQEVKTARNFINCRFPQRAMRVATTEQHYDAILKAHLEALKVLGTIKG